MAAIAPAGRSPGAQEVAAAREGGAELQERRCLGGRRLPHELRTNPQGEGKGMEEQLLGQNMSECTVEGDIIIRAGINPGREWKEETFRNVS